MSALIASAGILSGSEAGNYYTYNLLFLNLRIAIIRT